MQKKEQNLVLLAMIFAVSLIISNVVGAKVIDTGIPLFGATIVIPGAVLCYAITFLITDIVGEVWGREQANSIVKFGFVAQILATSLIVLTQFLPAIDPSMQVAYNKLLGQNVFFALGSLTAYLVAQSYDVWIFHKVRNYFVTKSGNNKARWIWNNFSTMTSQILDTIVFILISFGVGFGWLFDSAMWPTLGAMVVGQYLVKFILALLDTPIFYLCTSTENK